MSDIDTHLTNAIIAPKPEAPVVDRAPVIDEKTKADNYRRLKYPVLVTEHADGTRSFKHDIVNRQSDGLISSVSTDRRAHAGIPRGSNGYGAEQDPNT